MRDEPCLPRNRTCIVRTGSTFRPNSARMSVRCASAAGETAATRAAAQRDRARFRMTGGRSVLGNGFGRFRSERSWGRLCEHGATPSPQGSGSVPSVLGGVAEQGLVSALNGPTRRDAASQLLLRTVLASAPSPVFLARSSSRIAHQCWSERPTGPKALCTLCAMCTSEPGARSWAPSRPRRGSHCSRYSCSLGRQRSVVS